MFQKATHGIPNITRDNYLTNCFTIVFDLCKDGSPQNALSTRSGDLVRVDLQNLTAGVASECWMTLFFYECIAIRESGVTVLS